jgi:hypothetical protein
MFMSGLAVSAYFLPQWRVLHVLQGSIYIVVILMTRRLSTWGFGGRRAARDFLELPCAFPITRR